MTKDANIKRAARARARLTGQNYAKVRAEIERDDLALARDILGETPISIEQVLISGRGWAEPFVHRVTTRSKVVYLKHGPHAKTGGSYALEAWAYRLCRSHGVFAPEVIDASEPGGDLDYIATIALPGASLWQQPRAQSGEARRSVLNQAGEHLRVLHEIEMEGYGPITRPGVGCDSSWRVLIETARTDNLPALVALGALTETEAAEIAGRLGEAIDYIAPDGPSRLLHGNLEGDHIFADGMRFTGFIDFGDMQAGDPLFDLARFAWWDAQHLSDLLDGYGRDAITDEDLHVRMPAYLIANATRVIDELRRNIRPAAGAGEFVKIACAVSFGQSKGRIAATAPAPQGPFDALVNGVRGKTDEQIDTFAASVGGYEPLLRMVFDGISAIQQPSGDCQVGWNLGAGLEYVFTSRNGKNATPKRKVGKAPCVVQMSPVDFLRYICFELPMAEGIPAGRIRVSGDISELQRMYGHV